MMAPEVYQRARADAPMHLQLCRTGSRDDLRRGRFTGRVVRVFRDHDRQLRWGQRISFRVPVIDRRPGGDVELSGTIHLDGDRLGAARWFEAFVEHWDDRFQLVYSQICPIRHPTRAPVCGPDVKGFVCDGNL